MCEKYRPRLTQLAWIIRLNEETNFIWFAALFGQNPIEKLTMIQNSPATEKYKICCDDVYRAKRIIDYWYLKRLEIFEDFKEGVNTFEHALLEQFNKQTTELITSNVQDLTRDLRGSRTHNCSAYHNCSLLLPNLDGFS